MAEKCPHHNPTCQLLPPLPHPPQSSKSSRVIKKTIVVSSNKQGVKAKCSTTMEYRVFALVVVSLTPSQCSVAVSKLVTQQLGFQAVLLDSKCFPFIRNEGKGTPKILAALKSHHEKSTRQSGESTRQSGDNKSIGEPIEVTDEEPGPSTKRRCTEDVEVNQ